jgi:hypothetical protein
MPDWPLFEGQRFESGGHDLTNSRGTTVTTGAANTKSASWVVIMAATGFDASGILVQLSDTGAGGDFLVDIAVGGAGSEVVIAANLAASTGTGSIARGANYFLPIHIPAGTRITAKSQSNLATATVRAILTLYSQGMMAQQNLSRVVTYGANTAASRGTPFDSGSTTANSKGTADPGSAAGGGYFTIGTTTEDHRAIILAFPGIGSGTAVRLSNSWLVDVTIGASGARTTLIPNLQLQCSTSDDTVVPNCLGPFYVNIPSGTVLGIRAQSQITTATRIVDCIIYGIS